MDRMGPCLWVLGTRGICLEMGIWLRSWVSSTRAVGAALEQGLCRAWEVLLPWLSCNPAQRGCSTCAAAWPALGVRVNNRKLVPR